MKREREGKRKGEEERGNVYPQKTTVLKCYTQMSRYLMDN